MAHFTLASIFTSKQPEFNCNVDQDGIFNLTRHVEKDSSPVYPFIKHGDHEAGFQEIIVKCHSNHPPQCFEWYFTDHNRGQHSKRKYRYLFRAEAHYSIVYKTVHFNWELLVREIFMCFKFMIIVHCSSQSISRSHHFSTRSSHSLRTVYYNHEIEN